MSLSWPIRKSLNPSQADGLAGHANSLLGNDEIKVRKRLMKSREERILPVSGELFKRKTLFKKIEPRPLVEDELASSP